MNLVTVSDVEKVRDCSLKLRPFKWGHTLLPGIPEKSRPSCAGGWVQEPSNQILQINDPLARLLHMVQNSVDNSIVITIRTGKLKNILII